MHLPLTTTLLLTLLLLTAPSQPQPLTLAPPGGPQIGVPTCRRLPGGFTLLLCARLLTNLKNLPDYTKQEIWSEYARGAYRLPVVFVQQQQTDDATTTGQQQQQKQTCHLSMDLYEPGVPVTASETFSLQGEQGDLNRIYFECLKGRGTAGPPTSATTAPTIITVVVVVFERLDDADVCDGRGATGVVVVRLVEESGRRRWVRKARIGGEEGRVYIALYQEWQTGLYISPYVRASHQHLVGLTNTLLQAHILHQKANTPIGDKSVATKHGVPMGQEIVLTFHLSALQLDESGTKKHT
ncbi:MAG: hypothetical protein ASARMPREDX12_005676 [Alectoria sarmentosa]|nr:MAG: hypothetical protein ASARMPREDX12_005676 [Alectoria sarmentosa]